MNTQPTNTGNEEMMDDDTFIIKAFLYANKTFETDPEFSEQMHNEIVRTANSEVDLQKLHPITRVTMLNYLKTATWQRAGKRGHIHIDKNGDQYVLKEHFEKEFQAMQLLSRKTAYSIIFARAFADIAEKIADELSLYNNMHDYEVLFPYTSDEDKLNFAHFYAALFTQFAQEKFSLTLKQPNIFKLESGSDTTLGFAVAIDENGVKTPIIGITSLGMALKDMAHFCEVIQHELVHEFIIQLGLQHKQEYVYPADEQYRYDFMIVAGKGFNKGISNAPYPELYEGDSEEAVCNYAGHATYKRLSTFSSTRQITHQPLLDI